MNTPMLSIALRFPKDMTEREMQIVAFSVNTHYTTLCLVHGVLPDATTAARRRVLEEVRSHVQAAFPDIVFEIVETDRR